MKRLTMVLAIPLLMFALASCASSSGGASAPEGVWGEQAQGKPWIELSADGKVSGNDGCNRIAGQWAGNDGAINFEQLSSTKMFCLGIDPWLSSAVTAQINGDSMLVLDAENAELGTLKRAG
ncbi:META domain-containing protein [Glutamicibacter ardleyensis]|uniref:META domain-containing protein n=1 Tax=Glutamicibacter ardleyensis TaxID=225894 RepID=UPI003FD487C6